jgi:hypothetical protein
MKRGLAVLALCAAAACSRSDREILAGYRELWAQRGPSRAESTCPDGDAKMAAMKPVILLAADASKARKEYDKPLPADVAARLLQTDLLVAGDFRCLADAPGSVSRLSSMHVMLGILSSLLLDKADALAAAGDEAGAHRHLLEAVRLYAEPQPWWYIWFFQVSYVLDRATTLLEKHPATDDAVRADLRAAAGRAVMTRATFCDGVKEELLVQGALFFRAHLEPLRSEMLARWPELKELGEIDSPRGDRTEWATFRALWDVMVTRCEAWPDVRDARPLLAKLPPNPRMIFSATVERVAIFDKLRESSARFESILR